MNALACTWILALLPSLAVAQVPSVFIADLTWTEVRDAIAAGKTTALYYAGSTEQNGPGVALGKHPFVATTWRNASRRRWAMPWCPRSCPMPRQAIRVTKTGHMAFPGTVSVSEATYGAVAREVVHSAIAAGCTARRPDGRSWGRATHPQAGRGGAPCGGVTQRYPRLVHP